MAFYDYRGEENILRFCNLLNVNCSDTFVSSHACKQEDCCDFDNNVSVTVKCIKVVNLESYIPLCWDRTIAY